MTEQELWMREVARRAVVVVISSDFPETLFALNERNFRTKLTPMQKDEVCRVTVRVRGRKRHFFELIATVSFPFPTSTDRELSVQIVVLSYTPPDPALPTSAPLSSHTAVLRLRLNDANDLVPETGT